MQTHFLPFGCYILLLVVHLLWNIKSSTFSTFLYMKLFLQSFEKWFAKTKVTKQTWFRCNLCNYLVLLLDQVIPLAYNSLKKMAIFFKIKVSLAHWTLVACSHYCLSRVNVSLGTLSLLFAGLEYRIMQNFCFFKFPCIKFTLCIFPLSIERRNFSYANITRNTSLHITRQIYWDKVWYIYNTVQLGWWTFNEVWFQIGSWALIKYITVGPDTRWSMRCLSHNIYPSKPMWSSMWGSTSPEMAEHTDVSLLTYQHQIHKPEYSH